MTLTSTKLGLDYVQPADSILNYPGVMQQAILTIDSDWGQEFADFLQDGVVGNAALVNASGPTINSSTGVVSVTLNSDYAWITTSGPILTRFALPTSTINITPSSLPTSGNYRNLGVYVGPSGTWSATGALQGAVGSSESTAALALANPPSSAPSTTILLMYVIIGNASGVYSIASSTDERTWARGNAYANSFTGWVPLTLGTNVTTNPVVGANAAGRTTIDAATRLRGQLINSSGSTLAIGTTIATVPLAAGLPSVTVNYGLVGWLAPIPTMTTVYVQITDGGAMSLLSGWINATILTLDGVSYGLN